MIWIMPCDAVRKNYRERNALLSTASTKKPIPAFFEKIHVPWQATLLEVCPPFSKALLRWTSGSNLAPLRRWRCKDITCCFLGSYLGLAFMNPPWCPRMATWQNLSQNRSFQILILLRIPIWSSSALFHTGVISDFYWPIFSLWITCKSLWN